MNGFFPDDYRKWKIFHSRRTQTLRVVGQIEKGEIS